MSFQKMWVSFCRSQEGVPFATMKKTGKTEESDDEEDSQD